MDKSRSKAGRPNGGNASRNKSTILGENSVPDRINSIEEDIPDNVSQNNQNSKAIDL